jgi:acylphosphatase
MKRVRVLVAGRVQGVFFRATCAEQARRLGLGGWVRNRPDGRVEGAFEGEDGAVDRIVDWCHRGPELAHVEEVEVVAEEPRGEVRFRVDG